MTVLNSPAVADDNGRAINRARRVSLVVYCNFINIDPCNSISRASASITVQDPQFKASIKKIDPTTSRGML